MRLIAMVTLLFAAGCGSNFPGFCESITDACACMRAPQCRTVTEACFCPTECNGAVCICGGGKFLSCKSN